MYSLIHVSPMVRFSLSASTYLSILSYKLHNAERKKDVHAKTSQQLTKTGCTANDEFFHGRGGGEGVGNGDPIYEKRIEWEDPRNVPKQVIYFPLRSFPYPSFRSFTHAIFVFLFLPGFKFMW